MYQESHSFPHKGKWCKNPKCIRVREQIQSHFQQYGHIGEKLFSDFLDQEDTQDCLSYSKHAEKRFVEKSINTTQLFNEVIDNGYVIDYDHDKSVVTIMGHMKIGKGRYRPLHIPMELTWTKQGIFGHVITAYDPKFSSHLYDHTLERRVCFCQPHEQ